MMNLLKCMEEGKTSWESGMRILRGACQQPQERLQGTLADTSIFRKKLLRGYVLRQLCCAQLPSYPANRSKFRFLHPFNIVSGV